MFIFFNTENEIKVPTDSAGLAFVENWLIRRTGQENGVVHFTRDHFYHDLPGHPLAPRGASFRQSAKKPSYCFKYPVSDRDGIMVRREVVTKCGNYFLDPTNPFHRRTPVLARLRSFLETECQAELDDALHVVLRITCARRYRIVWQPNGDRLMGVAFDTVRATWPDRSGPEAQWCEVEFETGANMPEGISTADAFVTELEAAGLRRTAEGKYATALRLLRAAA